MAATVANVTTPNSGQTYMSIDPFRGVLIDVTGDASYTTGGYTITAASLGLSVVYGGIMMREFTNSTGTTLLTAKLAPNAAGTALVVQLEWYGGQGASKASLVEIDAATNVTTYTGRILVIGY